MPQSNQIQRTSIVFGIRGWRWELLSSGIEEKPAGNSADHPFKNLGYEVKVRNGVEGVHNKASWFCFVFCL